MEELLKEVLLCENDKYLLCYHRGKLIIRKSEDYNIVKTFHLHGGIRSIPIVERLLRLVPRTAVSISKDDFIFSHDGKIYRYTVNNNALCIEHYFINAGQPTLSSRAYPILHSRFAARAAFFL